MKRLGAAVIGCGSWGRNHARVYSDIKNVKLEAVADTLEKNARDIGEKHRVSWSTEPDTVIQSPNIDLVSICTPTVTHYELALRAIESGKHVLVEKPMTNTLEEAKELIKAAQRNNVKLTVGFVERFNTAVEEALNLIRAGEIGDVILAHTRRLSRRPLRIGDVGVIKDLAIHDIDITNQLFPGMPDSVYAIAGNIAHQFEDYANISIRHPKNRTAFI
jgi:UDP-N-acetylglucosamine 3-dehydrogenase